MASCAVNKTTQQSYQPWITQVIITEPNIIHEKS